MSEVMHIGDRVYWFPNLIDKKPCYADVVDLQGDRLTLVIQCGRLQLLREAVPHRNDPSLVRTTPRALQETGVWATREEIWESQGLVDKQPPKPVTKLQAPNAGKVAPV